MRRRAIIQAGAATVGESGGGGGGFTPPYSLPGEGAALYVAGQNTIQSVRPATHSADNWVYTLFNAFGFAGVFLEAYSDGGALAIAGTGGHNAPSNSGAAIFDFADGLWRFRACVNAGFTELDNTATPADYAPGATSGTPYYEITGAAPVPAPAHPYASAIALPAALGGGTRGSYLYVTRGATTSQVGTISNGVHAFDVDTGLWTRLTDATAARSSFDMTVVLDPVAARAYVLTNSEHSFQNLHYLDIATGEFATTANFGFPSQLSGTYMLDPQRRLLVAHDGTSLRAVDLNNIAGGWNDLTVSGTLPSGFEFAHWCYHPTRDRFYRVPPGGGLTLGRLTPPASSPLTNAWVVDTEALTGDAPHDFSAETGIFPYRALVYVPAIDRLAWFSGIAAAITNSQQVTLINPGSA